MWNDWAPNRVRDTACINVNEPLELKYWAHYFGITERELRQAVIAAGVSVQHVREWLMQ